METLKAEKRDMSVKAKALRRQGKIVGNVCGKDMKVTVPLQFDVKEAGRFLGAHAKGSQAILDLEGQKMNVLLKDTSYDPMKRQFISIDFQALVSDEKITSTVPIFLLNEDQTQGFLTHNISELTYKAFPADLIEKIEIDVAEFPIGTNLLVSDLEIAKNPKISLVTPADSCVLHIADHQKHGGAVADADAEEEEAVAAEA